LCPTRVKSWFGDGLNRFPFRFHTLSRVENGHSVPFVETLEKLARALEVPLYELFYEGEKPPTLPRLPERVPAEDTLWGSTGKQARVLSNFRRLLAGMDERDRQLLLDRAHKMARRRGSLTS
jgi:transcriptional regulator with XRE-family HTH domain